MATQFVRDTIQAIEKQTGIRLGELEKDFYERHLKLVEARLGLKKYRDGNYSGLIPVSNLDGEDNDDNAETVRYTLYTKIGVAHIKTTKTYIRNLEQKMNELEKSVSWSIRWGKILRYLIMIFIIMSTGILVWPLIAW